MAPPLYWVREPSVASLIQHLQRFYKTELDALVKLSIQQAKREECELKPTKETVNTFLTTNKNQVIATTFHLKHVFGLVKLLQHSDRLVRRLTMKVIFKLLCLSPPFEQCLRKLDVTNSGRVYLTIPPLVTHCFNGFNEETDMYAADNEGFSLYLNHLEKLLPRLNNATLLRDQNSLNTDKLAQVVTQVFAAPAETYPYQQAVESPSADHYDPQDLLIVYHFEPVLVSSLRSSSGQAALSPRQFGLLQWLQVQWTHLLFEKRPAVPTESSATSSNSQSSLALPTRKHSNRPFGSSTSLLRRTGTGLSSVSRGSARTASTTTTTTTTNREVNTSKVSVYVRACMSMHNHDSAVDTGTGTGGCCSDEFISSYRKASQKPKKDQTRSRINKNLQKMLEKSMAEAQFLDIANPVSFQLSPSAATYNWKSAAAKRRIMSMVAESDSMDALKFELQKEGVQHPVITTAKLSMNLFQNIEGSEIGHGRITDTDLPRSVCEAEAGASDDEQLQESERPATQGRQSELMMKFQSLLIAADEKVSRSSSNVFDRNGQSDTGPSLYVSSAELDGRHVENPFVFPTRRLKAPHCDLYMDKEALAKMESRRQTLSEE